MNAGEQTYYFESLPKCDDELVKKHFGEQSIHRDLGRDIFLFYQITRNEKYLSIVRIKVKDTGCHLQTVTQRFRVHHQVLTNLKLRPDDVWIVTYPKCGTTWTQELVWNIVNGVQVRLGPLALVELEVEAVL